MNFEDFKNFNILRNYFDENCKNLIFYNESYLEGKKYAKMYYLNVDSLTEKNNYKKVFQEYLVLYARSYERLRYFKFEDKSISSDLLRYGRSTWSQKGLLLNKNIETLGIFGELFNDFYLNIVKNENILLTYSSRHGFSERNVKGVDIVGCTVENQKFTIIFSECKFVESATSATNSLCEDITGKKEEKGHISKEYINSFTDYLIDKGHSLYNDSSNDSNIILSTLNIINQRTYNGELPINVFNDLKVNVRFVFFAIYTDDKFTPLERKDNFNKILNNFNSEIVKVGIDNYDIEIVFIPITNKSKEIKEYMSKWD